MKILVIGCLLGAAFWFMMFSPAFELTRTIHNSYFWLAMSIATLTLSAFSLFNQREKFATLFRFERKFLVIGVVHAVLLYGLSRLGVFLLSYFFSETQPYIEAVYQTRMQAPPLVIGLLLLFWIGPSEEIFWRGFVQDRLGEKFGAQKAFLLTVALYAGVHVWAMNPLLLLAAGVLGIHWGLMYKRFGSLVPGIISHALWDATIFVLFPVTF